MQSAVNDQRIAGLIKWWKEQKRVEKKERAENEKAFKQMLIKQGVGRGPLEKVMDALTGWDIIYKVKD